MNRVRQAIQQLRQGISQREIAKNLSMSRDLIREIDTIAKKNDWLESRGMPSDEQIAQSEFYAQEQKSHELDEKKDKIKEWVDKGYSAVVIHRLLEDVYPKSVCSLRRYLRKNFPKTPQPVMVRETKPGETMEVDFGELGLVQDKDGKNRKAYVFSLRCAHSGKAYRSVVTNQKAETFFQHHVYGFEFFGGVPKFLVLDNLKAGVIKSTIDNDFLNRAYQDLAEHYKVILNPNLPYTPQHKGGVESDIKYVKRNFLPVFKEQEREKGRVIPGIEDMQKALQEWDEEVASCRNMRGQPISPEEIFLSEEKSMLQPLPASRWEEVSWAERRVLRTWRVHYENSHYSVPYRLIGKKVYLFVTNQWVRIYHKHHEVALHRRTRQKGEFLYRKEHAPANELEVLLCTKEGLIELAKRVGPHTHCFIEKLFDSSKVVSRLRAARCTIKLEKIFSKERLEKACERAVFYNALRYDSVKNILEKGLEKKEEISPNRSVLNPDFLFARDHGFFTFTNKKENIHESIH